MEQSDKKQCRHCEQWLEFSEFYRYPKNRDGLRHECKKCWYKQSQAWFKKNPGKMSLYMKKYSNLHKEKRHEYYLKNKDHNIEKTYIWRSKNKEKYRLINKKSRLKNIEKRKIYEKEHYWSNPEYYRVKVARWRIENPERAKQYNKIHAPIWRSKNREKVRQISKNRKARLRGAEGKTTALDWLWMKEKYFYLCLSCFKREPEIKLTQDHVFPIIKGGNNKIENIQPLCRSCNSIKHIKTIDYRYLYLGRDEFGAYAPVRN